MWAIYGYHGVAIQSTVGDLTSALAESKRAFSFGRLTYTDTLGTGVGNSADAADDCLTLRPYFLKRSEYASEQEVRFVTTAAEQEELGGIVLGGMNPKEWIKSVRLAPGLSRVEVKCLVERIQEILPEIDCAASDLLNHPDRSHYLDSLMERMQRSRNREWDQGYDEIPPVLKQV